MKSLVKMGLPMVISMLIMAVYNIADTFWVSHLGTIPIAAVSICFPFCVNIYGGRTDFRCRRWSICLPTVGKKKLDEASVVASVSVLTAFMSGIFIMTFCNLFIHRILCYMGADDASINIAIGYGRLFTVCCAIGVSMWHQRIFSCRKGLPKSLLRQWLRALSSIWDLCPYLSISWFRSEWIDVCKHCFPTNNSPHILLAL